RRHGGGVAGPQERAVGPGPPCSCTSTWWRVLQPRPPRSVGMFVAVRPSSTARASSRCATSSGSSPSWDSAYSSCGISSSAKPRARAWISRSSGVSPYTRAPSVVELARPVVEPGETLTDCSVYGPLAAMTTVPRSADAVVVGGGTNGAWTAWFLRQAGPGDVSLAERDPLAQGASARSAGMVRAQGGTEAAVRLGLFSRDFYAGQQEALGTHSRFVRRGYLISGVH